MFLIERFGAGALGKQINFVNLLQVAELSHIRDIYRIAGTKEQNRLTSGQWEIVMELDRLAAEDG